MALKDEHAEYSVARAVWLYQRWCRALLLPHDSRRINRCRALGDRLNRWLRDSDRSLVHEYYRRIA